MLNEVLGVNRL